jgi:hypothetical protein
MDRRAKVGSDLYKEGQFMMDQDQQLRDVAANLDKIVVTITSRTPRGAIKIDGTWYSKAIDGMISAGQQTKAFHLLIQ